MASVNEIVVPVRIVLTIAFETEPVKPEPEPEPEPAPSADAWWTMYAQAANDFRNAINTEAQDRAWHRLTVLARKGAPEDPERALWLNALAAAADLFFFNPERPMTRQQVIDHLVEVATSRPEPRT